MNWTDEKPTRLGYYWPRNYLLAENEDWVTVGTIKTDIETETETFERAERDQITHEPAIVHVFRLWDGAPGSMPPEFTFTGNDMGFNVNDVVEGEWCGPILPPIEGIDNYNVVPPRTINSRQASESFTPRDPDMEPFDIEWRYKSYDPDGGRIVSSFKSRKIYKLGEQINFFGGPYIVTQEDMTEGLFRYSLTPDSIPDVKYLGSTQNGEQYSYSERHSEAAAYSAVGMQRVANTPPPMGQKYGPGARVRIADDLGPAMRHFPKGRMATVRYTYAHAFGGDDVTSYCLDVDGIGETSWYKEDQLTLVGERFRVPPPTQTMIEDAGPPSTFVQDRLAEALVPEPSQLCGRCGEQINRQADGELWEHVSNKSIYCPNDDTGCSIATPISEPGASIAEVATVPRRYLQLTDYEKEGQLFQIEFREDLFELKVQNENGKPVILTLTERELRDAKNPVDAVRDFMVDAGVPADLIDESAVEDARRSCDEPVKWTLNYRWPTIDTIDFKTPLPGDGPIPVVVTIIAPDGQQFSWDVQGQVKDNALLSPDLSEVWAEICDWQKAWVPQA